MSTRFINSWENYYLEILMAAGILVYFINFFTGKSKNARVASAWFDAHKVWMDTFVGMKSCKKSICVLKPETDPNGITQRL